MSWLGEAWVLIKSNPFMFQVGRLRPTERLGFDLGYIVIKEQN